MGTRSAERRVLRGRTGDAGWTLEQERDSDRGIRRAVAPTWHDAGRSGDRRRDDWSAANFDDVPGVHSRRRAAGDSYVRGREWPAFRGYDCVWWDDHVDVPEFVLHSGAVSDY